MGMHACQISPGLHVCACPQSVSGCRTQAPQAGPGREGSQHCKREPECEGGQPSQPDSREFFPGGPRQRLLLSSLRLVLCKVACGSGAACAAATIPPPLSSGMIQPGMHGHLAAPGPTALLMCGVRRRGTSAALVQTLPCLLGMAHVLQPASPGAPESAPATFLSLTAPMTAVQRCPRASACASDLSAVSSGQHCSLAQLFKASFLFSCAALNLQPARLVTCP